MELKGILGCFWILALQANVLVAPDSKESPGSIKSPDLEVFLCGETMVCNVDTWQFCSLDGDATCRHCSDFESKCWSQEMPLNCSRFCHEKELDRQRVQGCMPVQAISYGRHNGSVNGARHGDVIGLVCETGYQPVDLTSIQCLDFGQYSGTLRCEEIVCEPLHSTRNGHHNGSRTGTMYGDVISLQCDAGHKPVGSTIVTCGESGKYSGTFVCDAKDEKNISLKMVIIYAVLGTTFFWLTIFLTCFCVRCMRRKKRGGKVDTPETTSMLGSDVTLDMEKIDASKKDKRHVVAVDKRSRHTKTDDLTDEGKKKSPDEASNKAGTDSTFKKEGETGSKACTGGTTINLNFGNMISNKMENILKQKQDSKKKKEEGAFPPPKPTEIDKHPTQETDDNPKTCRCELEDSADPSIAEAVVDMETEVKGIPSQYHSSKDKYTNPVQEQEKDPLKPKLLCQARRDDDKKVKLAVGKHDIVEGDLDGKDRQEIKL